MFLVFVLVAALSGLISAAFIDQYTVPEPSFKIYPRGFEVSIPDDDGVQLFAFHGNINKRMDGLEAGQFSTDIIKKTNGRWTFKNKLTRLQRGDKIYFWLFVIRNNLGYRFDDGVYEVRGFQVSITNEPGMQIFAFNANINKPLNQWEEGEINGIGVKRRGQWFFTSDQQLQNTDKLFYRLYVLKDNKEYIFNGYHQVKKKTIPFEEQPEPEIVTRAPQSKPQECKSATDPYSLILPNLTQRLIDLQDEIGNLKTDAAIYREIIEHGSAGHNLTFGGTLPYAGEDDALYIVVSLLKSKLSVSVPVTKAVINPDKTVSFEVETLDDKLKVIKAAKEGLKYSKVTLKY